MGFRRWGRTVAAASTVALALCALAAPAQAEPVSTPVYFVHGYNGSSVGDCGGGWATNREYFAERGWNSDALKTVGYYWGDLGCDVSVGSHTADTPIVEVAADLANYLYETHTTRGEVVDIVAHSMGGLISRVALIGSAHRWEGFPPGDLLVGDVVTLGTPHQGVLCGVECADTTQWQEMLPGSPFMNELHAAENQLNAEWPANVDWTYVASDEDEVVSGDSALDTGFYADHTFRYLGGNASPVDHSGLVELNEGDYNLRFGHANGESHDVTDGWNPVEATYNAVLHDAGW